MSDDDDTNVSQQRRNLLRTLALAAGTAAVLPVLTQPAVARSFPAPDDVRRRYERNDWIERYYELNRL